MVYLGVASVVVVDVITTTIVVKWRLWLCFLLSLIMLSVVIVALFAILGVFGSGRCCWFYDDVHVYVIFNVFI